MRIIIGIYQNQDEAAAFYRKRQADPSSITEVGPFFSKDQARSWTECLSSRISRCEVVSVSEDLGTQAAWYGFTFEEQD